MLEMPVPVGELLIAPEYANKVESLLNSLAHSIDGAKERLANANQGDDFWNPKYSWLRPYNVKDGVLIIPVKGVLLHNFPYAFGTYATGYDYISAAVNRGVDDSNVKKIILDSDSPGGMVSGCFDCVDQIYNARGKKPIVAFANEFAYSAAYAIVSGADSIGVSRTGGVGSIGVITEHYDMSRMLDNMGVKITPIFAGKHKADGHPAIPLSEKSHIKIQERIDALYDIFVSTVARNRGLDEKVVRDTEAGLFMAKEAVEIGLADFQGGLDLTSANADPLQEGEEEMSNDTTSTVELAVKKEDLDAARAEGVTEGKELGIKSERERIEAILDSEEAKARPALARELALNTDMAPEVAAKVLSAAAKESAESAIGASAFEAAMNNSANPEVGAGDGLQASDDEAFLAEYRGLIGRA